MVTRWKRNIKKSGDFDSLFFPSLLAIGDPPKNKITSIYHYFILYFANFFNKKKGYYFNLQIVLIQCNWLLMLQQKICRSRRTLFVNLVLSSGIDFCFFALVAWLIFVVLLLLWWWWWSIESLSRVPGVFLWSTYYLVLSLSLKEKGFDVCGYGRGAKGIEKDFVINAHCCWCFRTLEKKKKKFAGFCFSE